MRNWSFLHTNETSGELMVITGVEGVQNVISDIGFGIFEVCTVVGVSLFLTIILRKVLSIIEVKDPDKKVFKFLSDILITWLVLFSFEAFVFLIEYFFSILVKGYPLPTSLERINYSGSYITLDVIVDLIVKFTWIDFVLIGIFYTVLGFNAFRKIRQYESLIKRISLDIIQGILILIELFLLLIPFETGPTILAADVFLSLYWLFIGVIFIESLWLVNHQIEVEKKKSGQEYNISISMILFVGVFLSLSFLITAFPQPFLLFFANPIVFLFILFFIFVSSFCIVVFSYLLEKTGISNSLTGLIDNRTQNFRYKIGKYIASKGTVFNYPSPINIIGDDISPVDPISGIIRKIKLRIACGSCFHVFNVETEVRSSKIRTFPCPFCGSMATTPVWE